MTFLYKLSVVNKLFGFILYQTPQIASNELNEILNLLENIKNKHNLSYKTIDGSQLGSNDPFYKIIPKYNLK